MSAAGAAAPPPAANPPEPKQPATAPPPPPPGKKKGPPPPPPPGKKKGPPPPPLGKGKLGGMKKAGGAVITWAPVTPGEDSIWRQSVDLDVTIDINDLKAAFENKGKAAGKGAVAFKPVVPKKVQIRLLDEKKARSVEISLRSVKKSPAEIKRCILHMDTDALGDACEPMVDTIKKYGPDDQETNKLKAFTGDPADLGLAEQLFLALLPIPRLAAKLHVLQYLCNLNDRSKQVLADIRFVILLSCKIQDSKLLRTVLRAVLKMGNELNEHAGQGRVEGFALGDLDKVIKMKAFMPYLCEVLAGTGKPELLHFWQDFFDGPKRNMLEAAMKMDQKALHEAVAEVSKGRDSVANELEACQRDAAAAAAVATQDSTSTPAPGRPAEDSSSSDPPVVGAGRGTKAGAEAATDGKGLADERRREVDVTVQALQQVLDKQVDPVVEEVKDMLQKMEEATEGLSRYWSGDPKTMPFSTITQLLHNFVTQFRREQADWEKKRQLQALQRKREEEKKRREAKLAAAAAAAAAFAAESQSTTPATSAAATAVANGVGSHSHSGQARTDAAGASGVLSPAAAAAARAVATPPVVSAAAAAEAVDSRLKLDSNARERTDMGANGSAEGSRGESRSLSQPREEVGESRRSTGVGVASGLGPQETQLGREGQVSKGSSGVLVEGSQRHHAADRLAEHAGVKEHRPLPRAVTGALRTTARAATGPPPPPLAGRGVGAEVGASTSALEVEARLAVRGSRGDTVVLSAQTSPAGREPPQQQPLDSSSLLKEKLRQWRPQVEVRGDDSDSSSSSSSAVMG